MATVGLKNLVYCKLTSDDETAVVYDVEVTKMAKIIDATITPSSSVDNLYADDGIAETVTSLGNIEVELEVDDLKNEVLAALLGHTIDTNGVLIKSFNDSPPYVAIGFKSKKANDSMKYIWLYKGKFSLNSQEHHTQEDGTDFKTDTISSTFIKRNYNDEYQAVADEDSLEPAEVDLVTGVWFDAVYEKDATLI